MIIIISITAIIVLFFSLIKIFLHLQFGNRVKKIFRGSERSLVKSYDPDMLTGLPMAVQQYFGHVLTDGQPYIQSVRLTHSGVFKTDLKKE